MESPCRYIFYAAAIDPDMIVRSLPMLPDRVSTPEYNCSFSPDLNCRLPVKIFRSQRLLFSFDLSSGTTLL